MERFTYYMPTEVIFGKETEQQVGTAVRKWGGSKVLLVYGEGSVVKSGLLDQVKESLESEGIYYEGIGGVVPNPRLGLVIEGAKQARAMEADFILAIGGGSAIDTAKGIALSNGNPDLDVWEDIWLEKVNVTQSTPLGVVLTLSAAGSETSESSVLMHEETGRKKVLSIGLNRPKFAIMNPELTYTIPRRQLSCGIVDIMMHTMERYFSSVQGNELTDHIAEGLLRVTMKNGKVAMENQKSYQAMSELMWSGSISHNGLTGLGGVADFATHRIGHELSAKYDTYHGESLSVIWASWARFVCQTECTRHAQYAKAIFDMEGENTKECALQGIVATEAYFASVDMPICFGDLEEGVRPDNELREMAQRATLNNTITLGSIMKLDEEAVYEILKMANH
ncbi:MAG: iron-containing alcohol dehydrogenase [Eubacteriales bacterium]